MPVLEKARQGNVEMRRLYENTANWELEAFGNSAGNSTAIQCNSEGFPAIRAFWGGQNASVAAIRATNT